MLNVVKNEENELEVKFVIKEYDIEAMLKEKYLKHKTIFQIITICISLFIIIKQFKKIKDYNQTIEKEPFVNMYICTHKDFRYKVIRNPAYKILCDDKTELTRNYNLEIIETNKNNILYPKRIGYSEGSKIYPIWKLYKEGNITSKYVGLFHYRRIFPFKNDIPNLDEIFEKYDAIVRKKDDLHTSIYKQFEDSHIIHYLDESIDIIKEKYPEYYNDTQVLFNNVTINFCNIFIAKKEDFIKWGELVFGVLLELDNRYNLTTDDDIKKLIMKEPKVIEKKLDIDYQSRLQAFLMERIGYIFYEHQWKKRLELPTVDMK